MPYNSITLDSVPTYLVDKIPEISFLLATVLIFFASDYIMEYFLKKSLKRMNFVTRTIIFLIYGLLILPVLSTVCALFLQNSVLYPLQGWIVMVLLASFLLVGILLNIRYNMKVRLKI
jgi:FtsH-binding integral membrane protein